MWHDRGDKIITARVQLGSRYVTSVAVRPVSRAAFDEPRGDVRHELVAGRRDVDLDRLRRAGRPHDHVRSCVRLRAACRTMRPECLSTSIVDETLHVRGDQDMPPRSSVCLGQHSPRGAAGRLSTHTMREVGSFWPTSPSAPSRTHRRGPLPRGRHHVKDFVKNKQLRNVTSPDALAQGGLVRTRGFGYGREIADERHVATPRLMPWTWSRTAASSQPPPADVDHAEGQSALPLNGTT